MIKTLSDANICPNQDRSISGNLCQKWNKDFPHVTKLSTISNVLKKTGSLDHNNCVYGLVSNDPSIGCNIIGVVIFIPHKLCMNYVRVFLAIATHLRSSCYTTDRNTRWEYCDCNVHNVTVCGTVSQTMDFEYDKFDSEANRIPSLGTRLRECHFKRTRF